MGLQKRIQTTGSERESESLVDNRAAAPRWCNFWFHEFVETRRVSDWGSIVVIRAMIIFSTKRIIYDHVIFSREGCPVEMKKWQGLAPEGTVRMRLRIEGEGQVKSIRVMRAPSGV